MISIYEHYKKTTSIADNWLYFANAQFDFELDSIFNNTNSSNFIESYFSYGGKSEAFDWMSQNSLFKIYNDRANHTVSAYILGVVVRDALHMRVRKGIPRLHDIYKKNFLYFWSFICLYHDASYNIENNSIEFIDSCRNIHAFVKRFDIQYNLLDAIKDTTTKHLITKYYLLRASKGVIDHGIAGAMLFYNGLMKTYNIAKEKNKITKKETFENRGLRFSKDFEKHIRFIACTIAQHNMWRADKKTKQEYIDHQLNLLIPNKNNDHKLTYGINNDLLFLLGLVDTIEPLKCLNSIEPYYILENLLCKFNYDKFEVTFKCNSTMLDSYRHRINGLNDWMNVEIVQATDSITIKINKDKELERDKAA